MRKSRFALLVRNFPDSGEHVLYSTLLDEYVGMDDGALLALERGERGDPLDPEERGAVDELREAGFLVEGRAEDDKNLWRHLKEMSGVEGEVRITLMPTIACNLACNYCFQKDMPQSKSMKPPTEQATLAWILGRVSETASRKLHVLYFGGEPLLHKDFCIRTAEHFTREMRKRGGEFSCNIVTNGVLLDRPWVEAMLPLGLKNVKVTLDGDKSSHDRFRVYRDGRGTFEKIMANVKEVCALVPVNIGGNYSNDDTEPYHRLLEQLARDGMQKLLGDVNFKPVLETSASKDGCAGCSLSAADPNKFAQLIVDIDKKGFHRKPVKSGPCEIHWERSFSIDPEGFIYKCPGVAGTRTLAIGHVAGGEPLRADPLAGARPWRECGDCAFLPQCFGSCYAAAYLRIGQTNTVNCEKRYFETAGMELVKRRYLEEFYPGREMPAPGAATVAA